MNIAVLTDQGSKGGASIAATRLGVGLRRRGHTVARLYLAGDYPAADTVDRLLPLAEPSVWVARLTTVLKIEPWRRFVQRRWSARLAEALATFRPDVIHAHNLHGAGWDIELMARCQALAPTVWTLHDAWALTGSCAFPMECRKYETACDRRCPQLGQYPTLPAHMIGPAHRRRRRFYATRPRLALVAPSAWLAALARAVVGPAVPVLRISNGLPTAIFASPSRAECRRALGLDDDGRPTALVVAQFWDQERKGLPLLIEALRRLRPAPMRLTLLGRGRPFEPPAGIEVRYVQEAGGDPFLALVYGAADLLIHPSLADNQPLAVAEALAAGLPVVALPVGGVPEMVRPGRTGWLAAAPTAEALAGAIGAALAARAEWPAYAERCRAEARQEYDLDRQAARYERLLAAFAGGRRLDQAELDSLIGERTEQLSERPSESC